MATPPIRPPPIKGISTTEFRRALVKLVADQPIKIWLVKSIHGRLDPLFAVGETRAKDVKMFDHIGGLYLLGEGVPPDMVHQIHSLFERYCHSHPVPARVVISAGISVNYRAFRYPGMHQRNKLVMHVPFSVDSSDRQAG
jgi:hypothetical protein